jgi:glycosyltransferase involved in cell wall biosynthesis
MQVVLDSTFYGAERVAYSLCKGLRAAGAAVVLVTSAALREKFSETDPSSLYVLPDHEGSVLKRAELILRDAACLRQIISREGPDVIHVHGQLARLVMLVTNADRKVVETLHGVSPVRSEAFRRLTFRLSDSLAALSFDGTVFYTGGIIGGHSSLRLLRPTEVIYNPVDPEFLRLVSKTTRPPAGGEYLLWCGRLDAEKGPELLLRAFARLDRTDIALVLLGDGPQSGYLRRLATSLAIQGRTTFLGYVDGVEKGRFFQHASAVCVDLINPGISQSLLEAVFSGNRAIACYDPEVEREFGEAVVLLSEPSIDALAAILSEALARKRSRGVPAVLGERFSLKSFADRHLDFYSRLGPRR